MSSVSRRTGEKTGWIGGWLGGFVWVVILAVLMLLQGERLGGALGLALAGSAVAGVLALAPWRHPDTPFWKLMLPVYALFVVSIAWAVWFAKDPSFLGVSAWHAFLLLPLVAPFFTVGGHRWRDRKAAGDRLDPP